MALFWDTALRELPTIGATVSDVLNGQAVTVQNGISWNKTFSDNPYDRVMLPNWDTYQGFPGICEVRGKSARAVDRKKARGSNGMTLTYIGYEPAEVEIRCTVWTPNQFKVMDSLLRTFWPRSDMKPPDPVEVFHPSLDQLGIGKIVIESIDTPQPNGAGVYIYTFRCHEWRPPPKQEAQQSKSKATFTPKDIPLTTTKSSKVLDATPPHNANGARAVPPSQTDSGPNGAKPHGASGTW